MIKLLTTALDWRAMGRLRANQHTHAGVRVSEVADFIITSVDTKYQREPHRAVGKFVDGKLVAYICAYQAQDFWVLDLMVNDTDRPTDLYECLEDLLVHYESKGITQFYYAFPQKWARAYRSFWKSGCPTLRKYTIEDVHVIEPGKIPPPWYWEHIVHETIIQMPLLVRRSYVKSACD